LLTAWAGEPTVADDAVIDVRPIGWVRAPPGSDHQEIEVRSEFAEGLEGVEDLDHLWVLFWMHELSPDRRRQLKVHPRGDRSRPLTGVFALHSPMRPNPIGATRVRLVRREGCRLLVEGLDAHDGSPVLDLKSG